LRACVRWLCVVVLLCIVGCVCLPIAVLAERTLLDLFPDIGCCINLCELSAKSAGIRKVTNQGLQALVGAGLGCVLEKLELSRE